ncbi:MAG: VWA domain-containing protein [Candidatus Sericytochromatia bacterium]
MLDRFKSSFALTLLIGLQACIPATKITANPVIVINNPAETTSNAPVGTFQVLGGGGLDPTVARFCSGQAVAGEQGYARETAREYRQMIEKLLALKGFGSGNPSQGPGNIFGAPTPVPVGTPVPQNTPEPLPSATSDISVIEKSTFNGKIFDDSGRPLDGVKVRVRSLNSSVPFEAETVTAGGTYAFNNAPSGVQVEIVLSQEGFADRTRVEVIKSNKQGDPNANRYDFGTDGSNSAFSAGYNAFTDKPEVRAAAWLREQVDAPPQGLTLNFSEPMDKASVEKNISLHLRNVSVLGEQVAGPSQFQFVWSSDARVVQVKLPTGLQLEGDLSKYSWGLQAGDGKILDTTGVARTEKYFKLTDGDYEAILLPQRMRPTSSITVPTPLVTPRPQPSTVPTATPEPTPVPTPSPTVTPLPNPKNPRESFYFSYDDSASTAGVELAKQALQANQVPKPEWARPWEFLNYENFDHVQQTSTGLFQVSMGMTRRAHLNHPLLDTYELGVHVTAPYRCKTTRKNLVLTVVADVSNSMTEYAPLADEPGKAPPSRLDLLKAGLQQMLDQLKPGDVINLVTFAAKPFKEIEGLKVGTDLNPYLQIVKKLEPMGNTNLQAALEEGYRVAEKYRDVSKNNRLLFITDALPTEGSKDLAALKDLAARRNQQGLYLSAIGLGYEHNQSLLNALTEAGRGAYYSVVSKTDMKEAMTDRFIPLVDLAARNVRFKLEYPGQLYHGESAAEQVSQDPSKVQPTNFSFNTSQYFWEQFKANKVENLLDQKIKLEIRYSDVESRAAKTETYEKSLRELIGQDTANIQAAHLVYLFSALAKGTVSGAEVQAELNGPFQAIGK